jgi:hemoglobin
MIVRIWRTQIDQARAAEYRDFAHSTSLPMFRAQPGFAGVLFAAHRAERAVISLWHDLASVRALDQKTTVAEIQAAGFLRGQSAVEVLELEEAFLEDPALRSGAPTSPSRSDLEAPVTGARASETLYEHAGGEDGLREIVEVFYSSIFEDPVLQPVFGHPAATHVDHLTAFLAEEFGGPTRHSDELGGFPTVVAVHRGRKITEEQRRRFVRLFMTAVDEAGFASDARFKDAIASAIEFGSEVAVVNSHATSDDELHPQA